MTLEGLSGLIGARIVDTVTPWFGQATSDSIRHFARGYGDDNPLFSSPIYAAGTVRGAVAPMLFPLATGTPTWHDGLPGPTVDLDGLVGAPGQSISQQRWTFTRPITPGTELQRDRTLVAVTRQPTPESGTGADTWFVTENVTYHVEGVVYAVDERTRRYGRGGGTGNGGSGRRERATWSSEQLSEIEGVYAAQTRRGAEIRWADQVDLGHTLGPMVKGPLTTTDLLEYRAGVGPGPLGGEPLRLAYLNRQRRPHLYSADRSSAPDIIERRHWDDVYAAELGHPSAYDYSHTRLTWLSQLLSDWAGEAGWVCSLSGTTALGMNYVGDAHWLHGTVTALQASGRAEFAVATVAVHGVNQLGETTCAAEAEVLLPVRGRSAFVSGDAIASYVAAHQERSDG